MNILCFSTNLTSSELASWVQAIGSILAILAAATIAIWQSKKQHKSALALLIEEQKNNKIEKAKALLTICQNCTKAAKYYASEMNNREAIHLIAYKDKYVDFGELQTLQNSTSNIPLYSLPSALISHAMILGATMRQFKQNIENVLRTHEQINANQFKEFFEYSEEITKSLELTCNDIESEVKSFQQPTA